MPCPLCTGYGLLNLQPCIHEAPELDDILPEWEESMSAMDDILFDPDHSANTVALEQDMDETALVSAMPFVWAAIAFAELSGVIH